MSMKAVLRLALLAAALLGGGALVRRWLEEQQPTEVAEPDGTGSMTRKELYDRARELNIEGRSKMSKDGLAEAVRAAT